MPTSVTAAGKTLPATAADTLRVAAAGRARWTRGAFSPFVDFTVRHDSGDGDTGIAGDVDLGLNLSANGAGIDTARLLTGE